MAKPLTKTAEERMKRRALVSELYFEGRSMKEVGKMLGISHDTVFRDIRWSREQWRTKAADSVEAHKQRDLVKIDLLEREAIEAWIRSIGKKTKIREEDDENGKINKIIEITEQRAGDPRFLDQILKCVERRCKLLGLDAPTKSVVAGSSEELQALIDEARARVVAAKKKRRPYNRRK